MKLNKGKCNYIVMSKSGQEKFDIKFKDGTPLERVGEATYLGGNINEKVNGREEITAVISAAYPVWKALNDSGKNANCAIKWRLHVFNAVVISKLAYGLETVQYAESQAKRLDAFQLKGLRKSLSMATTSIDRNSSNKKVFEEANKHWESAGRKKKPATTIILPLIPISKCIQMRKLLY